MDGDKILTIMGSPGSGKTTAAIKLAQSIAARKKNVIVVFCDPFTPVIPYILPAGVPHKTSLGSLFTAPSLTQKQILNACVSVKESGYISLLGYCAGESLIRYPKITREKVIECMTCLRYLADYIIMDCTTVFAADTPSIAAIEHADHLLYLTTANLKGISYVQSHNPLLADRRFQREEKKMAIGNLKVGQDWEAVGELFGGIRHVLPFTPELEQQGNELSLFAPLTNTESVPYQLAIDHILEDVFALPGKDVTEAKKLKRGRVVRKERTKADESKGFKLLFGRKGEF